MRFAPDLDETPTLEIPEFRKRAQQLLHLMVGAEISAEEYLEKLELIEQTLKSVYQEAVTLTQAQHAYQISQLERRLAHTTRRPAKTDPGVGVPTIPPTPPLPDIQIEWLEDDEEQQ